MRILFLLMVATLQFCVGHSKAGSKSEIIPASLHGFYCSEGSVKGEDCPPLIIEAKSAFDTAMGGCNKIKDVIQTGNIYTVNCEEGESVSIKTVSKDKILLTVGKFTEIKERYKK